MPRKKKDKQYFPFELPVEMHTDLRVLSLIKNVSIAELIRQGIEKVLNENEKEIKKVKKNLTD